MSDTQLVHKPKCYSLLSMDCERVQNKNTYPAGPLSWSESEVNIIGFAETASSCGHKATFFAVPEAAKAHSDIFSSLQSKGHEVGLHLHPQTFKNGTDANLATLSYKQQLSIIGEAHSAFENAMGFAPTSFRAGYFSANKDTFRVLSKLGFTRGSSVFPGRNSSECDSNWQGRSTQCSYEDNYFEAPLSTRPHSTNTSRQLYISQIKDLLNKGFYFEAAKKSAIPLYQKIRFPSTRRNDTKVLDLRIEHGASILLSHLIIPLLDNEIRDSTFPTLSSFTHNYVNFSGNNKKGSEYGVSRNKCLEQILTYLNDRNDILVTSLTLSQLHEEYDKMFANNNSKTH